MKFQIAFILAFIFIIGIVSAINLPATSNTIYLDVNRTYPLVLIPLDENIWNITLNVYDGNWSTFNFTWTGTQYELSILFNTIGDYPFVINSTEVTGDIKGTFLVRKSFNVTFRFFRDKQSYPFFSNKYVNEYAYVIAEFTGQQSMFQNNYNPYVEPFFSPFRTTDVRYQKPVFYAPYRNGVATLKLYENTEYAVRLVDGQISFINEYSIPNITKSYGVNAYIGKYQLNGTNSYNLLLTTKDLSPYTWLFNWIAIILIVLCLLGALFIFFEIPDKTSIAITFGLIFPIIIIVLRLVIYIIWV